MHIVGVYHPDMTTHDQRELYLARLRRIYDSLKGKWQADTSSQVRHLHDSIKRDALRTDPGEPFYASNTDRRGEEPTEEGEGEEDNVQKLVNVILIYTLEHEGVSYTQGMSDLLSPILYVMQREDDAYICFSAMLEHIKGNFSLWCEGTLNKIERLRHICEVLDPQLYSYLSNHIQEDAFALFFGMVLIECRREFTFMDSFHLLEVAWSAYTCLGREFNATADPRRNPDPSPSQWAGFMTYESNDIIQQVFGEMESPYSAEPLGRTMSVTVSTAIHQQQSLRNSSLNSQRSSQRGSVATYSADVTIHSGTSNPKPSSPPSAGSIRGSNRSEPLPRPGSSSSEFPRRRSYTYPNRESLSPQSTGGTLRPLASAAVKAVSHSESQLCESSVHDNDNDDSPKHPTEMSDMSSVSSGGGPLQTSCKCTDVNGRCAGVGSRCSDVLSTNNTSSATTRTGTSTPPRDNKADSSSTAENVKVPPIATALKRDESYSGSYYTAQGSGKTINSTGDPPLEPEADSIERDGPSTLTRGGDSSSFATESVPLSFSYSTTSFRNGQPAARHRRELEQLSSTESPIQRSLDTDEYLQSRLSPVVFFDRMEQMATAVSSTPPHTRSRANSDISVIISHLISTEEAAPHISRNSSLDISFSASFPLFICLAIVVQSRSQIVGTRLDFVGLSVLLNAQAGMQNLDHTLQVARQLFKMYRYYQLMYFGPENGNRWLDALGTGMETRERDRTSASPDSAETISLHAAPV